MYLNHLERSKYILWIINIFSNATNFQISFIPIEYGKVKIGKLIIETDEVQWFYEVRGGHEDYKPPEIKQSNLYRQTEIGKIREIQSAKPQNVTSVKQLPTIGLKATQRDKSVSKFTTTKKLHN